MSGNAVLASSTALNRLAARIERAEWLDGVADALAKVLQPVVSPRPVTDVLSGAPLGHPLHPVLIALPLGSWTAAAYLDLTGDGEAAARRLVGFGAATALPTALSGASDWLSTHGAERRVGLVHAALNSTALMLYTGSWLARRRGAHRRGVTMALAGFAVVGVSGWLGGHLSYALGVGVDTTAFQRLPENWTDVGAESELGNEPVVREVDGVPVLLVKTSSGLRALADRCSHRGGPLHEGELVDGCIVCPWHGSTFRLEDGEVVTGPASRPQTPLEIRVLEGRVQVRRGDEPRSLRIEPIGV